MDLYNKNKCIKYAGIDKILQLHVIFGSYTITIEQLIPCLVFQGEFIFQLFYQQCGDHFTSCNLHAVYVQ